jgi:hypothetical protein
MLPVFGLYADYLNTATITLLFTDGSTQLNALIPTLPFSDPCGFNNRTVIQPRSSTRNLSYDYMLVKNVCGSFSPTIMDTDGEIRWVGTASAVGGASTVFQNAVYLASNSQLYRNEFDGAISFVRNYANVTFHHNMDYGKRGLILDEDVPEQTESVNAEVDADGNVLKTWDLAAIISNAMIAGGDDPSQFVAPAPNDWFHNNAVAYRKSDNSLAISSRENFVIGIDYDTGAIKWILGDPTKQWFQFPSLRKLALFTGPDTLPPIGQHAVSFTDDDRLLLFDDGQNSQNHQPPGMNRTYSAPRKYKLDLESNIATEIWNFPNGEALFSPFCSSVYEDSPNNYLIDYSIITNLGSNQFMELVGVSSSADTVFDYRYAELNCNDGWNAIPVHLDGMEFTSIVPTGAVSRKIHGSAGAVDVPLRLSGIPAVECRSGGSNGQYQVVVTFPRPVTIGAATVSHDARKQASVSAVPRGSDNEIVVNLSDIANAQTITVNLIGVSDGVTSDDVSIPMTVLTGDTSGNGSVNASDLSKAKSVLEEPATPSNYRSDVIADGEINDDDVSAIQSFIGTGVPGL